MGELSRWRRNLKRERVKLIMRCGALIERNGGERDRVPLPGLGKRAGGLTKQEFALRVYRLQETVLKYGWVCLRCGREDWLTLDHVWPKSKGWKLTMDNCQLLCRACNQWKSDRFVDFRDDPPLGRPGWDTEVPVPVGFDESVAKRATQLNRIGPTIQKLVNEVEAAYWRDGDGAR